MTLCGTGDWYLFHINDMAKVQQKSENVTPFGGIFFVLDNQPL